MRQDSAAKKIREHSLLVGKDEMNLIEFPLGPITPSASNVIEVPHVVRDRQTKQERIRKLTVRGAEGLGLPRPIDDCVMVGLKALTLEANFASPRIEFSRYQLCRTLGWPTDGATYARLAQSFDRLVGTTLKFEDSWWDKGEQEWTTRTFNLLSNVELCSMDRYTRARRKASWSGKSLSSFTWNDVVWKSFEDGNIRTLDMEMFRRVSNGRRREVPTRLFRWVAKHFYKRRYVTFDALKLCVGTLGVSARYPSEAKRALKRASDVLVDCGVLNSYRFRNGKNRKQEIIFEKKGKTTGGTSLTRQGDVTEQPETILREWLSNCTDEELAMAEDRLIAENAGSRFELDSICRDRKHGRSIRESGFVRLQLIKRFMESSQLYKAYAKV